MIANPSQRRYPPKGVESIGSSDREGRALSGPRPTHLYSSHRESDAGRARLCPGQGRRISIQAIANQTQGGPGFVFAETPCFNSRPREAGDLHQAALGADRKVSIHARAKRATKPRQPRRVSQRFQFTPARSGRRNGRSIVGEGGVSIHARAKRATRRAPGVCSRASVSIHARAKRATFRALRGNAPIHCFNSRPREAGDLKKCFSCLSHSVSIHARAKRATGGTMTGSITLYVSIHARAKRATSGSASGPTVTAVSIHARAKRATEHHDEDEPHATVSIHARAKRATNPSSDDTPGMKFQFTPARSGRPF